MRYCVNVVRSVSVHRLVCSRVTCYYLCLLATSSQLEANIELHAPCVFMWLAALFFTLWLCFPDVPTVVGVIPSWCFHRCLLSVFEFVSHTVMPRSAAGVQKLYAAHPLHPLTTYDRMLLNLRCAVHFFFNQTEHCRNRLSRQGTYSHHGTYSG